MILGIYGSGGAGKEVNDILRESPEVAKQWEKAVFIDDTVESGEYWGLERYPFEEFREKYPPEKAKVVIAVGEPKARETLYGRVKAAGYSLATIVHATATVSEKVTLGDREKRVIGLPAKAARRASASAIRITALYRA